MIFLIIAVSAALILLILLTILTFYGFNMITRARNFPEDKYCELLKSKGVDVKSSLDNAVKEYVEIRSIDNLMLKGVYIEGDPESNRAMVIVHGYEVSYVWSVQFADMFLKRGWSVLLIDMRRHGGSQGKYSTYGYMEKHDLDGWVNWLAGRKGEGCIIGLHGQSMGGGTVLEYAKLNKYVKFIISDCPYSDMTELIAHQLKSRHLPVYPLILLIDNMLSKRAGFRMKDVSPINAIRDSNIPVMFIHGSNDDFVPTYMSKNMYDAKNSSKRLLLIDGAAHGVSYLTDRELYEKETMDFVDEALSMA